MKKYITACLVIVLAIVGYSRAENDIDYVFISKMEGGQRLMAYVPDPNGSMSGVTIATGVDLGSRSEEDLKRLGLPAQLVKKLSPYVGLKKQAAVDKLSAHPLAQGHRTMNH